MSRPAGTRGLSTLEAVLTALLLVAFLVFAGPIVRRRRAPEAGPGDAVTALAAESAAEEALVRAPALPIPPSLDGTPATVVDVVVEPGPRDGLERVRVAAAVPAGATAQSGAARRLRLVVVRFFP